MPDRSNVPKQIPEFDKWIRNTNKRQLAVNADTSNPFWKDYGWTSAQSADFKTKWHDQWVNELYPSWSNALKKTKPVNEGVVRFMKKFKEMVRNQQLIAKIKSSAVASEAEALTWNFVLKRKQPSRHTVRIGKTIAAMVKAAGRGLIRCVVRYGGDESRPSIPRPDGADSVQYACAVFNTKEETMNEKLTPDEMRKEISTKASFQFDAGFANQAKWLVIYFRWYNTKHPNLAGTWSVMYVLAIA
jgi:hypothetical protein